MKIKDEVVERVRQMYGLQKKERFIPGKSKVNCSGCVYDEKELLSLIDIVFDFWITTGKHTHKFELMLSKFLGVKHAILVNSGSSANLLAVSALTSPELGERRLMPGDEVITTACTFPTMIAPIIQNQLVPVFIDVSLPTYTVDINQIEKAISKKTKAMFFAHTLGNVFDIGAVKQIAKKHNLYLIEDSCDALGSTYKGKKAGSFGDIGTYSFHPAHHITMGEGGAVVTSDPQLNSIIHSLQNWGKACWCEPGQDNCCGKRFSYQLGDLPYGYDHKYTYSHIGYNLKCTEMQAAIGVEQLKKLPSFMARRRENFDYLQDSLQLHDELILPQETDGSDPSWFGFPITVKSNSKFTKNDLVWYLESKKISTRTLFAGNILKQPGFKDIKHRVSGQLVTTDYIMNNSFWVGVYPGIDEQQRGYMISVFDEYLLW